MNCEALAQVSHSLTCIERFRTEHYNSVCMVAQYLQNLEKCPVFEKERENFEKSEENIEKESRSWNSLKMLLC